jgi:hypothetical protein
MKGLPQSLHVLPWGITTDGGITRRCTPEVAKSAMAWLGEPPSASYAAWYEVNRVVSMQRALEEVVAEHSIAEGDKRARLALEIADLHAAIGSAQVGS